MTRATRVTGKTRGKGTKSRRNRAPPVSTNPRAVKNRAKTTAKRDMYDRVMRAFSASPGWKQPSTMLARQILTICSDAKLIKRMANSKESTEQTRLRMLNLIKNNFLRRVGDVKTLEALDLRLAQLEKTEARKKAPAAGEKKKK